MRDDERSGPTRTTDSGPGRTGDDPGPARAGNVDEPDTGAKSAARRVAQEAGGTGTGGHAGTGAEDTLSSPGRWGVGSTGGAGYVGGSAMGDDGVGDTGGGIVPGMGESVGGSGSSGGSGMPAGGGVGDGSTPRASREPKRGKHG